MKDPSEHRNSNVTSRRGFLKSTAVATVGAGLALEKAVVNSAYAADDPTLRIGLVGCGGRGTGAARQALRADPYTKLIAVGDVFKEKLESSLKTLKETDVKDRVNVESDHQFVGFDAYMKVIDSGADIVLFATPPQFRPLHVKACIAAGKHVFAEKPVAVDAPGVRSVLQTTEEAKKKELMLVSGLCWRYETGMQETIKRLHDGAIGDIKSLYSTRYSGGVGKLVKRTDEMTDLEWQMRNCYYFTWLSGDFNVEQFVHEMDKMAWVMQDQYPVKCVSTGGRQTRIGEEYGNIYDHFSTVFEYENGVRYLAATRHQPGCSNPFRDNVVGTKGEANLMRFTITGENEWKWGKGRTVMTQLEHDAMYAALRNGEVINNGEYMAKSTMMGIMARMSAYTGKELTWEQAINSKEDLTPAHFDWKKPLSTPEVAMPGITPFV